MLIYFFIGSKLATYFNNKARKHMPANKKNKVLPITLKPKTHASLKEYCEKEDLRMTKVVSTLIERFLNGKIKLNLE